MGKRDRIKQNRTREVVIDGLTFTLYKPDVVNILRRFAMYPAAIIARQEVDAFPQDDEKLDLVKMAKARKSDFFGFVCACICDCCVDPKVVLTKEEADADETGDTIWLIELLGDPEQPNVQVLNDFAVPIAELLGLSLEEMKMSAPFRELRSNTKAGGQLGNQPVSTGAELAAAGL